MKRATFHVLITVLILCLCACGANDISLEDVQKLSQEELGEKLVGLSQKEIQEMWGNPDSFLSGLWGDIYLLPENNMMIILFYETDITKAEHGHVIGFNVTQRQTE